MAAWIGLALFFGLPLLIICLITLDALRRPAEALGNDPEHNWCLTLRPLPRQPRKPPKEEEES